jgi:hypothetical protein
MYKIYLCQKEKTNISGYWQDKEGKIFVDNIKIIEVKTCFLLFKYILKEFDKGEKAIFVIENNNKAYIYYANGQIETLTRKMIFQCLEKDFQIKNWFKNFNGITVFNDDYFLTIETWTN